MSQRLKAVYCRGAFLPQEPCDVPEGSEVELTIEGPFLLSPEVKEPKEQAHILRAVVARMKHNPIPVGAPPLTRDWLHERP
jgi:predicted DNA-binding antitoxin AbrB/MazE fold protein